MRLFAILAFLFALRTHAILVPQPISRECDADDGSLVFQSVSGAASTQACDDSTGVCVAFSIPVTSDTTAENADILAAIKAPASLGWVAFGFGQQMTGSLVFVLWPDETNVVVSPRVALYRSPNINPELPLSFIAILFFPLVFRFRVRFLLCSPELTSLAAILNPQSTRAPPSPSFHPVSPPPFLPLNSQFPMQQPGRTLVSPDPSTFPLPLPV